VLDIINNWIFVARALVGSIGALALAIVKLVCITGSGDAAIDRSETQALAVLG
jgi:hypothetical protein